jgi:hypothetical protein
MKIPNVRIASTDPRREFPWDSVRRVKLKSGGRAIRHTINRLEPKHLDIVVVGLGRIGNHDLGQKLIVDQEGNTITGYITD